MRKWNGLGVVNFFLILILSSALIYLFIKREKIAYIDLSKTYNEFELKRELEKKSDEIIQKRKSIIDSLEFNLKLQSKHINDSKIKEEKKINEFELQRENYLYKKQQFDEDNETMIKKYDEQIYKQLNQYMKDFGELHKYTFIYGASGTGNLMYANKNYDQTEEVIKYINQKYSGKAK